jgi:hypothetical protein
MLQRHASHDPHILTCNHCHRPVVLIDYYGKLLKGCLGCNRWGRPGGNLWTRLPPDDLRAIEQTMERKAERPRPAAAAQEIAKLSLKIAGVLVVLSGGGIAAVDLGRWGRCLDSGESF